MATTFGEQIMQLALSMDIIDELSLNEITELIERYLVKVLGIQNSKVMIVDQVDREVMLMRHSLKGLKSEIAMPIKQEDGSLYGQASLAFEKNKPLWIVSAKGKQNLSSCEGYSDQWSGLRSIPKFRFLGNTEEPVKTRIIVPIVIRQNNRVFGTLILETCEYLDITEDAKKELKNIAEILSIVIRSHKITYALHSRTREAITSLENVLAKPLPPLTKPNLFLAYAQEAERDVTEIIIKTLKDEYSDKVVLINWEEMDQPGNINQQLIEAVGNCRYAICYLSQKSPAGEYIDNRNVIFEAGMFHGRTEWTSDIPSMWIPVREKDSPRPPFDFAQERILLVERNKDGSLKRKVFTNKFRERVDAMLNQT